MKITYSLLILCSLLSFLCSLSCDNPYMRRDLQGIMDDREEKNNPPPDTDWYPGNGSPYYISTAEQLAGLAQLVNNGTNFAGDEIILTADINLGIYDNWTPIGNETSTFIGTFDGDGHVISNLKINRHGVSHQGLFRRISDSGVVKNVGLVDAEIIGGSRTGGIAGTVGGGGSHSGIIEYCYVIDSSIIGINSTGGIAGMNYGTVRYCYTDCVVTGTDTTITGEGIGGVAGYNQEGGKVHDCYSLGEVNGGWADYAGGVVGFSGGLPVASLRNCYALGNTNGGGIMGRNNNHEVTNCVALNLFAGFNRIVAMNNSNATHTNNYARADMLVNGIKPTTDIGANARNGADISLGQYHDNDWWENIADFDFSAGGAWEWNTSTFLPILKGFEPNTQNHKVPGPYNISTAEELAGLAQVVNSGKDFAGETIILNADIDLNNLTPDASGSNWTPIGNSTNCFRGTFDGNHKIISNMNISRSGTGNQGLFGYIDGGTVKNVGVVDANVTGGIETGGIVGYNDKGTVNGCFFSGTVTTNDSQTGGIVGLSSGVVSNCYNTGNVTSTTGNGDNVGGILGRNLGGSVINCHNTGNIGGDASVGGIVGRGDSLLANSVSLGLSITGTDPVLNNRVIGQNEGTLTNNYARADMLVNGATVTGAHNDSNGADISLGQYHSEDWWRNAAGFDLTTVWEWNAATNLPILRGFAANTQMHEVP